MNLIDGLVAARAMLIAGRPAEACATIEALRLQAAPDAPWLRMVNLDALTVDDVAHLEWFVRQSSNDEQHVAPTIALHAGAITPVEVADGLAQVQAMLAAGRDDEAQTLLRQLYASTAAAQAPWLQFLVLDPPDQLELAYLEEYLRHHAAFRSGSRPQNMPDPAAGMPSRAAELATTFVTARAMLGAGRKKDAAWLLRQMIQNAPHTESPWLQLLALEPPPDEEIALLEGFLQHHPQHRFAPAFVARLDVVRTVAMLTEGKQEQHTGAPVPVEQPRPALGLGDYLIRQHWVTTEQIEHALAQQRALRAENVEQPLGTLLLIFGHVQLDQLAIAFAETTEAGFGSFADYLVRKGVLTASQVGHALAHQSALGLQHAQEIAARRSRTSFLTRPRRNREALPAPALGDLLVQLGLLTAEQSAALQAERQLAYDALFY